MIALLLAAVALAEPAVLVLPPGESPDLWRTPATLVGLELGSAGTGPQVSVEVHGASLRLVARDSQGNQKAMTVPAPRTAAEREDLLWLAVSLVDALAHPQTREGMAQETIRPASPPATRRASPSAPKPPPPRPARPHVDTEPSSQQEPAAPALAPASPPLVVVSVQVSPHLEALPTLEAARPRPHPTLWVGPRLWARPETTPTGGVELGLGASLGTGARLGAGLAWTGTQTLSGPESLVQMREADLFAGLWWSPPEARVGPLVGLALDLSWRSYAQDGAKIAENQVLGVASELGLAWRLSPRTTLALSARGSLDLASTQLQRADGTTLPRSPLLGGAGILAHVQIP